jgi:hypothetical protein
MLLKRLLAFISSYQSGSDPSEGYSVAGKRGTYFIIGVKIVFSTYVYRCCNTDCMFTTIFSNNIC